MITEPVARRSASPAPSNVYATQPREWSLPLILRQFLPGVFLLAVTLVALGPINDPDTFWHVRAGQELPADWQFAGPDPWNTFATEPWVLHEWLPQLLMGAITRWFGLPGLAVLTTAAVVGLTLLLYGTARRHTSIVVSTLLAAIGFIGMSMSLSARPHLVSFALAALTTSAWLRTAQDGKRRWWLVPLTWLWACSHGMWFVGIVIGVGAVLGMLVDPSTRATARRVAFVPLASLGAAALTPAGPSLLIAPFTVSDYTGFVTEWAPPSIFTPAVICALLLVTIPVFLWATSGARTPSIEVALAVIAVGLTLAYSRTVAMGAAMAVPLAAQAIGGRPLRREEVSRRERGLTGTLVCLGILIAAVLAPHKAAEPERVPTAFSSYLASQPADTVVCNDYMLGGWLLWAHPPLRPIVDGRTEVYAVPYIRNVVNWQAAGPGWENFMAGTGCRLAILPSLGATTTAMVNHLDWQELETHRGFSLLVAPTE